MNCIKTRVKLVALLLLSVLFFSCSQDEKKQNEEVEIISNQAEDKSVNDNGVKELPVQDSIQFKNGIVIRYRTHGEGKQIQPDEAVWIDYSCSLPNGEVFDTNKKMKKPLPFMVGWSMQTAGWDSVFPHLKEGDEVEVFLPANLARGEKGIPGLVPPNSANILSLKIHKIIEPISASGGVKIWVINRGDKMPDLKDGDEVLMDYFTSSKSHPRYDNSFKNGRPYQIKVGGKNNLPGLNVALKNAKLSDKLWVFIPAKMAFGTKGLVDFVKPNEPLFFDLRILKVLEK